MDSYRALLAVNGVLLSILCTIHTAMASVPYSTCTSFFSVHTALMDSYRALWAVNGALLSKLCTTYNAMASVPYSTCTSSFGVYRAFMDSCRALLAVHRALLAVCKSEVYRAVLDSIQGSFECA